MKLIDAVKAIKRKDPAMTELELNSHQMIVERNISTADEISELIVELGLEENAQLGDVFEALAPYFKATNHLTKISVSHITIHNKILNCLVDLAKHHQLVNIEFSNVYSCDGPKEKTDISRIIRECHNLQQIAFVNCIINEQILLSITQALQYTPKLERVTFSNCTLTDPVLTALATTISSRNIQYLNLSNNVVAGADVIALVNLLNICPRLTTLDLSGMQLSSSAIALVTSALYSHKNLTSLILNHNKIGDEGFSTVANYVATNPGLQVLDVAHNELTDTGIATMIPALALNQALQRLSLSGNEVSEPTLTTLLDNLRNLTTFTTLELDAMKGSTGAVYYFLSLNPPLRSLSMKEIKDNNPDMRTVFDMALRTNHHLETLYVDEPKVLEYALKTNRSLLYVSSDPHHDSNDFPELIINRKIRTVFDAYQQSEIICASHFAANSTIQALSEQQCELKNEYLKKLKWALKEFQALMNKSKSTDGISQLIYRFTELCKTIPFTPFEILWIGLDVATSHMSAYKLIHDTFSMHQDTIRARLQNLELIEQLTVALAIESTVLFDQNHQNYQSSELMRALYIALNRIVTPKFTLTSRTDCKIFSTSVYVIFSALKESCPNRADYIDAFVKLWASRYNTHELSFFDVLVHNERDLIAAIAGMGILIVHQEGKTLELVWNSCMNITPNEFLSDIAHKVEKIVAADFAQPLAASLPSLQAPQSAIAFFNKLPVTMLSSSDLIKYLKEKKLSLTVCAKEHDSLYKIAITISHTVHELAHRDISATQDDAGHLMNIATLLPSEIQKHDFVGLTDKPGDVTLILAADNANTANQFLRELLTAHCVANANLQLFAGEVVPVVQPPAAAIATLATETAAVTSAAETLPAAAKPTLTATSSTAATLTAGTLSWLSNAFRTAKEQKAQATLEQKAQEIENSFQL